MLSLPRPIPRVPRAVLLACVALGIAAALLLAGRIGIGMGIAVGTAARRLPALDAGAE